MKPRPGSVVALLATLFCGPPCRAEDEHTRRPSQAISIEPLGVVLARTIGLEYEVGIGHVGLFAGVCMTLGDLTVAEPVAKGGSFSAIGFNLGARFYPWSKAPAGPYIGPAVYLSVASADGGADSVVDSTWSFGGLVGWTWLLGRSFELATGLGASYFERISGVPSSGEHSFGVRPLLRLAVGAAF